MRWARNPYDSPYVEKLIAQLECSHLYRNWRCIYCDLELSLADVREFRLSCEHAYLCVGNAEKTCTRICKKCLDKVTEETPWKIRTRRKAVRVVPRVIVPLRSLRDSTPGIAGAAFASRGR